MRKADQVIVDKFSKPIIILTLGALLLVVSVGLTSYMRVSAGLRADRLYEDAIKSDAAGDLASARAKLAEIMKIDPSFKDAKDKLADIKRRIGSTGVSTMTANHKPVESSGNVENGPVGVIKQKQNVQPRRAGINEKLAASGSGSNLLKPVEGDLPGYRLIDSKEDTLSASRIYKPIDVGAGIRVLTVTIKRHSDSGQASEDVYSLKSEYPRNQRRIMIQGQMAYFGNNGSNTAILAWAQEDKTIELEAQSTSSALGAMQNTLVEIVSYL